MGIALQMLTINRKRALWIGTDNGNVLGWLHYAEEPILRPMVTEVLQIINDSRASNIICRIRYFPGKIHIFRGIDGAEKQARIASKDATSVTRSRFDYTWEPKQFVKEEHPDGAATALQIDWSQGGRMGQTGMAMFIRMLMEWDDLEECKCGKNHSTTISKIAECGDFKEARQKHIKTKAGKTVTQRLVREMTKKLDVNVLSFMMETHFGNTTIVRGRHSWKIKGVLQIIEERDKADREGTLLADTIYERVQTDGTQPDPC